MSLVPSATSSSSRLRSARAWAGVVNSGLPSLNGIQRCQVGVDRLLIEPDLAVGAEHLGRDDPHEPAALPDVVLRVGLVTLVPALAHQLLGPPPMLGRPGAPLVGAGVASALALVTATAAETWFACSRAIWACSLASCLRQSRSRISWSCSS